MNERSPPREARNRPWDRRGPSILVAVLAVLVFLPGVFGGFVYDDHRFVERNEAIRSLGNAFDFLLDPRTCAEESWEGIYRPARTFSFAVDHAFWGVNPRGFHVQSLLWHVVASLGLLVLLGRLGLGRTPATLAALLFAVHPVHAEAVSWVSSRSDVLSGALVFLALAVHAGGRPTLRRTAAVTGLAVLAMLAKEAAVMLAPLVVLLDLTILKPWGRPGSGRTQGTVRWARIGAQAGRAWAPLVIATLLYVALRQWRTAVYATEDHFGHLEHWWGGSYVTQLAVASRGFLLGLLSVAWPLGPRLDFYPAVDARIDAPVLIAVALLALILVVAVRSYRHRPRVTAGLLWFLFALFPTSNLLFTVGIPSADRFLYVPLAGLLLVLAPALGGSRRGLTIAVIVVLGLLAVRVSRTYRSDDDLWLDAPASSPRRLGHVARREYEEVLRVWEDDRHVDARLLIPGALETGQAAMDRMREVFGLRGTLPLVHTYMQMANLHRLRGDRRSAYRYLKLAGKAQRHHPKTSYLMALLYKDVGDLEGALAEYRLARERKFKDPLEESIARVLNDQAKLERADGSYGRALALLEESRREWPEDRGNRRMGAEIALLVRERERAFAAPPPASNDVNGLLGRGILLSQFGLWDEARSILTGLGRALPESIPVAVARARWGFEEAGDLPGAAAAYRAVLAMDGRNPAARLGLVRCGAFESDPGLTMDPARRLALLEGLPGTPAVLVLRARALRDLGRHDEARPLLRTAAEGRGPGVMDAIHDLWQDRARHE